jgi:hypothetical protein
MKRNLAVIILFFLFASSSFALFDSKKIDELEQEVSALKLEVAKLRSEIKDLKASVRSSGGSNSEIAAIATIAATYKENEPKMTEIGSDKIRIVKSDFDSEDLSTCTYCKIFSNILLENKNKFTVRVNLVVEVRGTGDKQQFIYEEQNFYIDLNAGETKNLAESFRVNDESVKAGNGLTFAARIASVVKYQ